MIKGEQNWSIKQDPSIASYFRISSEYSALALSVFWHWRCNSSVAPASEPLAPPLVSPIHFLRVVCQFSNQAQLLWKGRRLTLAFFRNWSSLLSQRRIDARWTPLPMRVKASSISMTLEALRSLTCGVLGCSSSSAHHRLCDLSLTSRPLSLSLCKRVDWVVPHMCTTSYNPHATVLQPRHGFE